MASPTYALVTASSQSFGSVESWYACSGSTYGAIASSGVDAQLGEPVGEAPVVGDLGRRHLAQHGPPAQVGGEPGIGGHPVEGEQFAVRDQAEQVDDGAAAVGWQATGWSGGDGQTAGAASG